MTTHTPLSRRGFVLGLGLAGAGLMLPVGRAGAATTMTPPPPTPAALPVLTWTKATSANGWRVVRNVPVTRVEGSSMVMALVAGDVSLVLLHCVRRYLYEIDDTVPQTELVGHTSLRRMTAAYESNHLSGTAVAIRPSWYPAGGEETMLQRDIVVVRDIIADCQGLVRWGGDELPCKQSQFAIDVPPGDKRLIQLAARIRSWRAVPGLGAGADVDPFSPTRRAVATSLASKQRQAHQ